MGSLPGLFMLCTMSPPPACSLEQPRCVGPPLYPSHTLTPLSPSSSILLLPTQPSSQHMTRSRVRIEQQKADQERVQAITKVRASHKAWLDFVVVAYINWAGCLETRSQTVKPSFLL